MIKSFSVEGLNESRDIELTFNRDLNIITGKNGSGKTNLLKLIWYMASSNLERTIPEIPFTRATLVTDAFSVTIARSRSKRRRSAKLEWTVGKESKSETLPVAAFGNPTSAVETANHQILPKSCPTVFFPTFRRIEGGFSIPETKRFREYTMGPSHMLSEAIAEYARTMGVGHHSFVASVSTNDIEVLLTRQYANVSDATNALHTELSQFISSTIAKSEAKRSKTESARLKDAHRVLGLIQKRVSKIEAQRKALMKPFDVLSELILQIFKDKGVRVTDKLTFGEAKEAISARMLSAGEKQMLSFLCYNAFSTNAAIFIDEPEISLHVDWQRLLLSILLEQQTGNQLIIATHSTFMFSKYPEKELMLDADRGDN